MTTSTKRPDGGELKPCPKCNASDHIEIDHNAYDTWWIMCGACGCEKNDLSSRGAAIEWWNTRAPAAMNAPAPQIDGPWDERLAFAICEEICDQLAAGVDETRMLAAKVVTSSRVKAAYQSMCTPASQPPVEGLALQPVADLEAIIKELQSAKDAFGEIRLDWSDPRDKCREGSAAINRAIALLHPQPAKGERP